MSYGNSAAVPPCMQDAYHSFQPFHGPYDWGSIFAFLSARAIPGVESIKDQRYRRTISLGGLAGAIEVRADYGSNGLVCEIFFPDGSAVPAIEAKIRTLFDLDTDICSAEEHLSGDPFLANLVALRSGLRVPGAWDGFEVAVRAILGQQISIAAARRLASTLAQLHGAEVSICGGTGWPDLHHVFPSAEALASVAEVGLGMPKARLNALRSLAEATVSDTHLFMPSPSLEEGVAKLRAIRGIGEWTAQYIAMRAMREPDAFPHTDIGLLRGVGALEGVRPASSDLLKRAEAWRPWRAYAAQHLWAADVASRA